MDGDEDALMVSAVVPAYNEGERIAGVLDVLTTYPNFSEVIVVDDGSRDNTPEIVSRYKVRYLRNPQNMGKGFSMGKGVNAAISDVIFFCDADIIGLKHSHIDQIVNPVLNNEVDMFVAARDRMGNCTSLGSEFLPVGGERAIRKKLWKRVPEYFKNNFRIETGLNLYAKYFGKGLRTKVFKGLSQTMKEKKYDLITAARQRWRLNIDLMKSLWRLLFVDSMDLLKRGILSPPEFILFWGSSFLKNLAISAGLIVSWPLFTLVGPLFSVRKIKQSE